MISQARVVQDDTFPPPLNLAYVTALMGIAVADDGPGAGTERVPPVRLRTSPGRMTLGLVT